MKKQSFTLAEKQAYVRIFNEAKSSTINHRGILTRVSRQQNIDKRNLAKWIKTISLGPIPNKMKDIRKIKTKKEPDHMEKYAVDFAMSRRERSLPVNANLVALSLKRKFAEELRSMTVDSIA